MDRGIIFSAPMVLALLAGRKTQTRRLATSPLARVVPGDRLWVRESCAAEELSRPPVKRAANRKERALLKRTEVTVADDLDGSDGVRYLADDRWQIIENTAEAGEQWSQLFHYRKRPSGLRGESVPSIHMPRWASRLTLIITEVRTDWLQNISASDAEAEGLIYENVITGAHCAGGHHIEETADRWWHGAEGDPEHQGHEHPVDAYADLWDRLHSDEGQRWDDNPKTVALSFRVEQRNIDR